MDFASYHLTTQWYHLRGHDGNNPPSNSPSQASHHKVCVSEAASAGTCFRTCMHTNISVTPAGCRQYLPPITCPAPPPAPRRKALQHLDCATIALHTTKEASHRTFSASPQTRQYSTPITLCDTTSEAQWQHRARHARRQVSHKVPMHVVIRGTNIFWHGCAENESETRSDHRPSTRMHYVESTYFLSLHFHRKKRFQPREILRYYAKEGRKK